VVTRLGRLIDRVRSNRLLYGSLALSTVLLVKVAVFDPNLEFKPVCFNLSFGGGFETVRGRQSPEFREAIRFNLARYGFRVSGEGRNYISFFTWLTTDSRKFWWNTSGAMRTVIDKRGIDPTLSGYERDNAIRRHVSCKLVEVYAIEKRDRSRAAEVPRSMQPPRPGHGRWRAP